MKNLTDFRKTVETGVDPRLISVNSCACHIYDNCYKTALVSVAVL